MGQDFSEIQYAMFFFLIKHRGVHHEEATSLEFGELDEGGGAEFTLVQVRALHVLRVRSLLAGAVPFVAHLTRQLLLRVDAGNMIVEFLQAGKLEVTLGARSMMRHLNEVTSNTIFL